MEDKDIKILETVVNYRKFDGIYNTNDVIFKSLEKLLRAYKQDKKMIDETSKYIENDSRFTLSPVARKVKEDLLKILKRN